MFNIKSNLKTIPLILSILLSTSLAFGQTTTIAGTVTDASNNETLYGVEVILNDGESGTTTDDNGKYLLTTQAGQQKISFAYIGFDQVDTIITVNANENIQLDIQVGERAENLEVIVVSGSKYDTKQKEVPVTIEVITPDIINKNNVTSLADVIERIPGVEITDGQANIRSGSGYAYGAGSRVSVILDDQPLLSAELSDAKWNFIPIENAQQIEVIKGSASVLYGSSALNGIIHVRTAYPTDKPFTSVSLYGGVYNAPRDRRSKWWGVNEEIRQPFQTGIYFAHRQKIKDNFDLVAGMNGHWLDSPVKGADERRFRANLNTRVRLPNNDKITFGINGSVMYHELGNFFLWEDGDTMNYIHINNPFGRDNYTSTTLDPWVTIFDKKENRHTVKGRLFNISKQRKGNPNSTNYIASTEYQFLRKFKTGWNFTAGALGQFLWVRSLLFQRDEDQIPGEPFPMIKGASGAVYSQVDKKFFDKLIVTLGGRWETFRIAGEQNTALPVFRTGLNYDAGKGNNIRASFGQGYRVPSFAERFIDQDITDDVNVLPNPELRPESGWSAEIGYKKTITKDKWKGHFDAAFFWMEYKDMTEFYFDVHYPDTLVEPDFQDLLRYIGFKSINVSQARIAGYEVSLFGSGKIGPIPIRLWTGYTYTLPVDLSRDSTNANIGTYLGNFAQGMFKVDSALAGGMLKYRSLHTARFDIEGDINNFTIGLALNYNSYMHAVDEVLVGEGEFGPLIQQLGVINGIDTWREAHPKGDPVVDLRLAYLLKDHHKFHFVTNNLFNREYTDRPGKMALTRSFNFKYQLTF